MELRVESVKNGQGVSYVVYSGETPLGTYSSLEEAIGAFLAFAELLHGSKLIMDGVLNELRSAWKIMPSDNDNNDGNCSLPSTTKP